jgi:hypothetical protein
MLPANEPVRKVDVPAKILSAGRRDRGLVRPARGLATLRRAGVLAEPRVTDEQGAPVFVEQALLETIEEAVRELAPGRAAHARRTLAEVEAARKSHAEQVDDLLEMVYQAQARGDQGRDVLDAFLDRFERWQNRDGVPKVDLLFDRVVLDRAPESLGILLLATTRLTREHFARRAAFVERLRVWLIGRAGRTEQRVDAMDADGAFTCSTFVLAMLRSVGVELIDATRWRVPTKEDLRWQREIGQKLLEWIAARIHGDLVRAKERVAEDRGSRRYRPLDVAGAALFGPETWPVGVDEVDPRGRELEVMLSWPSSPCDGEPPTATNPA